MTFPVVLITGASAGIGRALARAYARRGARLALLARRLDRLEQIAPECPNGARAIPCDVTRDGDLERAVEETLAHFGRIDVAIANAGYGVAGKIDRLDLDDYRRQFETNVFGVLRTVKAVLQPLRETQGRLAIIGSVNGYVPTPGWSAYVMSKFAVRGLAETLRIELDNQKVSVTHVAPGFVESELRMLDRHGRPVTDARDPIPRMLVMGSDVAALQIAEAIEARRAEVVLTRLGKSVTLLQRHMPWLTRSLTRIGTRLVTRSG